MYTFVCVAVAVLAAFACAVPCFSKHRRLLTAALCVDILLLAASAACLIAASVTAGEIFSDTALDAEYRAWAADAYGLWARVSGIFTAVLGGLLLVASLIRHPMRKTRVAVCALGTVLVLIFGGMYAVTAQNAVADLVTPIRLFTVGCACLVPLGAYTDTALARFSKKTDGKISRKK